MRLPAGGIFGGVPWRDMRLHLLRHMTRHRMMILFLESLLLIMRGETKTWGRLLHIVLLRGEAPRPLH